MKKIATILISIAIIMVVLVVILKTRKGNDNNTPSNNPDNSAIQETNVPEKIRNTEFSEYNPKFRFTGKFSQNFQLVQYIPEIEAMAIYDGSVPGGQIDNATIVVRYFEADRFLTLTTVDILNRKESTINGHATVTYEIKKKPEVPNFPNQPAWRNEQHIVTDVRFAPAGNTLFFVFAKNPSYSQKKFDKFLSEIIFHNDSASFVQPLQRATDRVTKKPFGIKISPNDSPVQPEKFSGYHTGVDYEALPGEENIETHVFAVCGGTVKEKKTESGYGGLLVQNCIIDNQPVTVVYGHMNISSIDQKTNDYLHPGKRIGILGKGYSTETDNERKHLHLGIHKGTEVNIKGYIQSQSELSGWLDFQKLNL